MPPEFDTNSLGATSGRRQRHEPKSSERLGLPMAREIVDLHGGKNLASTARLEWVRCSTSPSQLRPAFTKSHALGMRIARCYVQTGEDDPQRMITAVVEAQSAVLFFPRGGERWSRHGG